MNNPSTITRPSRDEILASLESLGEDPTASRVDALHARIDAAALPAGERAEAVRVAVDAARARLDAPIPESEKMPQKRIMAVLQLEAWVNNQAIAVDGRREVDVTRAVLGLSLARVHALRDNRESTDDLVSFNEMGHDGPYRVEAVDQVCAYFGVSALTEITEEKFAEARSEQGKLLNSQRVEGFVLAAARFGFGDLHLCSFHPTQAEAEGAMNASTDSRALSVVPAEVRLAGNGNIRYWRSLGEAVAQRRMQEEREPELPVDTSAENSRSQTSNESGVPEGCTHYIEGLFGSVTFLQYRKTSLVSYFAEYQGDRWEPMGTQPSAKGITPRDIADYYAGLPHEEFVAVMHAVWLSDGEASDAAVLLGISEDRIWQMNAGQADSAFCSRPATWKPDDSRDYLRGKGYEIDKAAIVSASAESSSLDM